MKYVRRALRWSLLGVAGLSSLLACNALFGIDPPVRVDEFDGEGGSNGNDDGCLLPSDCVEEGENYVCLFQICSPPCADDLDCTTSLGQGHRCLDTEDGAACVSTAQASCTASGSSCPEGTACVEGECWKECEEEEDCEPFGQSCEDGACRTKPNAAGDPCTNEGEVTCAEQASVERLICTDGFWEDHDSCDEGEFCDRTSSPSGECAEVPDECEGRTPGAAFCDGNVRHVCGADLVTLESTECESSQHCTQSTTNTCAECLPNEYACEGDVLTVCNEGLTGFEEEKDCSDEGASCSATAGDCTEFYCNEEQKRCVGDTLEVCNEDRSGFETLDECGEGLCDSVSLECKECIANSATCASSTSRLVCDETGLSEEEEPCATGTCSGPAGSAVCSCPSAPSDCSGAGTVCRGGQVATCGVDANGCLVTTNQLSCPNPQVCGGTFPNASCACPQVSQCDAAGEMNGAYCIGNTRVTCTAGPQSCQQASTMNCANVGTEQCVGNHPNAKCEKVYGDATLSGTMLNFPGKVLWLVQVVLNESVQVRRLGFLGSSMGNVIMVLYAPRDTANPGIPGSIITWTAEASVSTGRNEYNTVANPTLSAGTYWVGIIGEEVVHFHHTGSAAPTAYWDRTAGTWPPTLGAWYPAYPGETTQGQVFSQNKAKFYVVGVPN